MAAIDFKNAAGRVSYNAGTTDEGNLIKKSKTYQNLAEVTDSEELYRGLEAIASLSAYTLIEVERIETSVVSN